MNSLLLAPHADDETLFAAYTILRERPDVVVCFRAPRDGRAQEIREQETAAAMGFLGAEWEQWPYSEGRELPRDFLDLLVRRAGEYERCYAPAVEGGGHDEHNAVGRAAVAAFGPDRVGGYLTYTRDGGRSKWGDLVEPEPGWIALKLEALACYRSQIEREATRSWFYDLLDLREWSA
jgi:LmbE family N-acetylglucosaminyl deacetylase